MTDAVESAQLFGERDEAREVADVAMGMLVSRVEPRGEIILADPSIRGRDVLAAIWLAAETRAARLDRACE